jgi:hypothetical protein
LLRTVPRILSGVGRELWAPLCFVGELLQLSDGLYTACGRRALCTRHHSQPQHHQAAGVGHNPRSPTVTRYSSSLVEVDLQSSALHQRLGLRKHSILYCRCAASKRCRFHSMEEGALSGLHVPLFQLPMPSVAAAEDRPCTVNQPPQHCPYAGSCSHPALTSSCYMLQGWAPSSRGLKSSSTCMT